VSSELTPYRHAVLGFELALPPGTETHEDAEHVALVALEPIASGETGFRANVTVVVEELIPGTGVEAYTDRSLEIQAAAMHAFHLLDREATVIAGEEATRTLGHHDAQGVAVTAEQWRLIIAGRWAYTLTASCWSLDYDLKADAARAVVESLRPVGIAA
jgi:hypothetical protein